MALLGPNSLTTLIDTDDDSGRTYNAKITRTLGPGTYYVRIRHYRPRGTGKYEISVRQGE
jgi:tyrosinase